MFGGANMPAKVKATKEMIINAAFEVARETGAENINASLSFLQPLYLRGKKHARSISAHF